LLAHKPTNLDLLLWQLTDPSACAAVTVTVYRPGMLVLIVATLPGFAKPAGPVHANVLVPLPAPTFAVKLIEVVCGVPPALHATSSIVITGFWFRVTLAVSDAGLHPVPPEGLLTDIVSVNEPNALTVTTGCSACVSSKLTPAGPDQVM
jgi:hypothetical protein